MEVYTDGSRILGPDGIGYAGCGIWFGDNDIRNTSFPIDHSNPTHQLAELTSLQTALKFCRNAPSLYIKTDSQYSINCVNVWSKTWKRNGWITSNGKSVLHSDIINEMVSIVEYRDAKHMTTSISYVPGHKGIHGNEEADKLAKKASFLAQEHAMENTIYFDNNIFSHIWPCKFTVFLDQTEVIFNCVKQWHHYQKALLFNDYESARLILNAQTAQECKRLGRQVKDFDNDTWMKECLQIVIEGNCHKYSQNRNMLKYLLSTKRKRLVEARLDPIWGINISIEAAKSGAKWNGLNLSGKALMIVRDERF